MTAVVVLFNHNGLSHQINAILSDLRPDDCAVTEEIFRQLYPDERAPFGQMMDKVHERAEPTPSCREVLAKFGITNAQYSVSGVPMQPIS
jgi:hypothetical protein